jgi:hypothetical protein
LVFEIVSDGNLFRGGPNPSWPGALFWGRPEILGVVRGAGRAGQVRAECGPGAKMCAAGGQRCRRKRTEEEQASNRQPSSSPG